MASSESLSSDDKQFLASCEELLKDRYTENDEEFMKVFKAEPSQPPILESWWMPNSGGRRNDRRFNRRSEPYHTRDGPRGGREPWPPGRGRYGAHSGDYDGPRGSGHHSSRPRNY